MHYPVFHGSGYGYGNGWQYGYDSGRGYNSLYPGKGGSGKGYLDGKSEGAWPSRLNRQKFTPNPN